MNERVRRPNSHRAVRRRLLGAIACLSALCALDVAGALASSAGSQAERKKSRLSQTKFYTMQPFTVPVFEDNVVVEHFTLVIAFELADPDRRSEVYHLVPKLRDVIYRVLYRMVTFRRKNSPLPHVDAFKQSLFEATRELAGPELVSSLLVQQAFKRPLH